MALKSGFDDNMAPPVVHDNSDLPINESSSSIQGQSSSSEMPNNTAGLLHKLIKCFADVPKLENSDEECSNSGPQTRTRGRGRAEKLKSRWMNMVTSNDSSGLPPPPSVREIQTPEFPDGCQPEFDFIFENEYVSALTPVISNKSSRKAEKRMTCECSFTPEMAMEGRLGCTSPTECFNRMLYVECGSRCSAGGYCANKRFQRREYAPLELFKAGEKGLGLRSKSDLGAGDFLLEYVGEVIDFDQFQKRLFKYSKAGRKHWFFLALSAEHYLDATRKGNVARYINHSCDPNAEMQKWTVNGQIRIGFFTKRPIQVGEEITLDYQFETYGSQQLTCLCGSANCRGYIGKLVDVQLNELDIAKASRLQKEHEIGEKINKLQNDRNLLKTSAGLLDLCRLMLRTESYEHRKSVISLLQNQVAAFQENGLTKQNGSLKLDTFTTEFIRLHGLEVLWSWLEECRQVVNSDTNLIPPILSFLELLPFSNRNVLDDSQLLNFVDKMRKTQGESSEKSESLYNKWSNLKQIFRIPRMVVGERNRSKQDDFQRGGYHKQGGESSPLSSSWSSSWTSNSWVNNRTGHKFSNSNLNNSSSSAPKMSKEEMRKQFEQAIIEEETKRKGKELEQQISTSVCSEESHHSGDEGNVIAAILEDYGFDMSVVLTEISQLLLDPTFLDFLNNISADDPSILISRLSNFPTIKQVISILSSSKNNDEDCHRVSQDVESLPQGWASATDIATGQVYFYNLKTKQTQWEAPKVSNRKRMSHGTVHRLEESSRMPGATSSKKVSRMEHHGSVDSGLLEFIHLLHN